MLIIELYFGIWLAVKEVIGLGQLFMVMESRLVRDFSDMNRGWEIVYILKGSPSGTTGAGNSG